MRFLFAPLAALFMFPACATATVAADPAETGKAVGNVIAKVGDQAITFDEINIAINSSAIVGVSIPALGTPQRDTARITVLDRFISANLLYLDALDKGVDRDPVYRKTIDRFSNAMLAGLYRKRIMAGDIPVSDEEIQRYFKQHLPADTEMTDDLHTQIEATLRRQKLHERMATADRTLRDGIEVVVHEENLAAGDDGTRAPDTPLAEAGAETITWEQIDDRIIAAGKGATMADPLAFAQEARRNALEREIDLRIMVQKARAAGLDDDPLYLKRMKEYGKTLLTNLHRARLAKSMEPSEAALKAYYQANRKRFVVPEARKVQMVVVKTREQAEQIRGRIESGEISLYEAARDYSTAVNARQNLGEVGWLSQGEMAPAVDREIFSLEPGELGEPVESPAGWHLVKVLEVKDARFTNFDDEATRRLTRRKYLHEKVDAYTADLRKSRFPVEVYQERLVQLEQQEADAVKALARQADEPGSVTHERVRELNRFIKSAK